MSRPQRYRLTHEFLLRNASDYHVASRLYRDAIAQVGAMLVPNIQQDYLALEKCEEPLSKPKEQ
jgi:hypothetical protein